MSYRERIQASLTALEGEIHRVVESQEEIATTQIVDSIAEQMRLEELLDASKPPRPVGTADLHYLLATPFRYPPLKYGSRFGRPFEKSLFYGSLTVGTALAEMAFYRFAFLKHLKVPFSAPLKTQHTVFSVRMRTSKGLRLQAQEWAEDHEALTDPASYATCQALGTEMRQCGVEAFQFLSSRARQAGIYRLPYASGTGLDGVNAALFVPKALKDKKPRSSRPLIIITSPEAVTMSLTNADGSKKGIEFSPDAFLVDGRLPDPAS